MTDNSQYIWTEKYRPSTLDGYAFTDQKQKQLIEAWIKEKNIPHLLFSGSPGVGKTTLAKILINTLDVNDLDVLKINASRENNVDTMRDKITNFISTFPLGEFKVVLLDEADYLSQNAQGILRGLMESYAATSRFILTCNYPYKIMPALHSRCQGFHIEKPDRNEFTERLANVLIAENIEFNLDVLDTFVSATYPDLRKAINLLQSNSKSGTLTTPSKGEAATSEWLIDAIELFKAKKLIAARETVCSNAQPEDFGAVYRWMYEHVDVWSDTKEGQDSAILIIADALYKHPSMADPEINFSACCIQLSRL